ncbi:two-component system sensor histidine kinase RppB [Trichothermofontia sp.]
MKYNPIFQTTRLRLAGLYAGTMGVILTVFAVGFYEVILHNHLSEFHHRIESVAGTFHDSLEAVLQQPGQLEPIVLKLIPNLCVGSSDCRDQSQALHYLGIFQEEGYYIRFLSLSGQLLASAGRVPTDLPIQITEEHWQTLAADSGTRYRQFSLRLKTRNHVPWGYMQVGRSLSDVDDHMVGVKWSLAIGLPTAWLLVLGASWWLAGQAMQPVYRAYRQIQQFTADAAHELRTPLAAIRANLEATLNPEATAADAWETLRTVERQSTRLAQLVNDLLLLSRMDLQGQPPRLQPCNLNDLVSDLVEEFTALAIAANLSLTANIQTDRAVIIWGSEAQLYRLVANLITNAIQYTPAGGQITIHLKQEMPYALIQVQDTGIGIPLNEQTRVFDRFYRVHCDRSRDTGGAGLGLAIAQAIVQAHHGSILIDSQPGKGSIFTIKLPTKASLKACMNTSEFPN